MRASLVIPTLNEAASIAHVLRLFRTAARAANESVFRDDPLEWEVLVVDGVSSDGTPAIAEAEGARVILEPRRGYGRAYRTGFAGARGEIIATADGDATYPVETVPMLVKKVRDEGIDFLTGNRMAYLDRTAMTTEHRIGNLILNEFVDLAFRRYLRDLPGQRLTDSQSGFWVFRRALLDRLHLTQDGMAFSEELKIEAVLRGARIVEVPIRYGERWGPPKLSSWRDGVRNLLFLVEKRFEVAREVRQGAPTAFAERTGNRSPP